MSRCVLLAAMVAAAAASSPAYAEDIVAYQTEGDAPAASENARTMALDAAFAQAVQTALAELVAPEVRTARKGEIDKEIVGRARLWVAKFSVTKDETIENRRELTVSVRVDRDKLRARLGELGIAMKDLSGPSNPTGTGNGTEPGTSAQKTATVLLRVATPKGVEASYGPGANSEIASALNNVLRVRGYTVRKAPASGAAPKAEGDLPLSDDEAEALANEAKADSIVIAGASVAAPVVVRGNAGTAALVTANVRLVERKGGEKKVVGWGTGTAAALGDAYAINRALMLASSDMLPPAAAKLGAASAYKGDDTPVTEPGMVLVRLPARTPMSLVLLEQKYLAGAKGVRAATLRRLSPNGWVIGVATNEAIEQVARIAKKAPSSDSSASVKIVGDVVEVSLQGSS